MRSRPPSMHNSGLSIRLDPAPKAKLVSLALLPPCYVRAAKAAGRDRRLVPRRTISALIHRTGLLTQPAVDWYANGFGLAACRNTGN
jgi:hypothetical protein